jgi:hypothetical protein
LSPGTRGIATHRALELLASRELSPTAPPTQAEIAASVERALAATFGPARRAFRALFELEAARLTDVLARFVEAEARRPSFRTVGIEQRTEARVGAFTIACRFDRLDELADGTLALIDYKSGARRAKLRWLDGRLASVQLPLYALEIGPRLSALLTLELGGRAVSYHGVARRPELIADTLRAVPEARAWTALLERWRTQIRTLVEEYAGGDVRVYAEDWRDAAGEYAPLTRVYAHAGLRQPEANREE